MDIIVQPVTNALLVAYKPIEFKVQIDTSIDDCPLMFCDIYINGIYYKSHSKTTPYSISTGSKVFQFDIEDALQEYLTKYIAPCGGAVAYQHQNGMASVYVKFRETIINGDGFIESPETAPIQGTFETAPVAGNGLQSNSFYIVNATLQQKELQTLPQHLNTFKQGTWSVDKYPLTHRLPSCLIKLGQSDFYPVLHTESLGVICYILNYKLKGDTVYSQINSCDGEGGGINIEWQWNKDTNEFVDLTSRMNGTFSYINWGDGTIDTSLTHTYTVAGNYTVWVYNSTSTLLDLSEVVDAFSLDVVIASFAAPYYITDLILFNNGLGSLTLTLMSALTYADLHDNELSVLGTIPTNVVYFDASINKLDVAAVNQALIDLDTNGKLNGFASFVNQIPTATPTGAGATAKANLISKGWTVNTD